MILTDAIAIVTPYGRYERVMRNGKKALQCGHATVMDEIAWQWDGTDCRADEPPAPDLPVELCNACMKAWIMAFIEAGRKTVA